MCGTPLLSSSENIRRHMMICPMILPETLTAEAVSEGVVSVSGVFVRVQSTTTVPANNFVSQ